MNANDTLGDRMKSYESVSRYTLARKVPVIVRVDGRSFHTWTRGLHKPFDTDLVEAMSNATRHLADSIQGCRLAYVQSDEASFLLTDWDRPESEPWFGYDLAKVVSLAASGMTAMFNDCARGAGLLSTAKDDTLYVRSPAQFDARAFNVPFDDVANYFLWRAKDWRRNSIQMAAQAHFSAKQIHGKKLDELCSMLDGIGESWLSLPDHLRCGQFYLPASGTFLDHVSPFYSTVEALVSKCTGPPTPVASIIDDNQPVTKEDV